MSKSTAARYAQSRRDNETKARDELKSLIPEQYFTDDIVDSGELNMSTKVLIATKNYLSDLVTNDQESDEVGEGDATSDGSTNKKQPFSIPKNEASDGNEDETIRHLRQVATRLVQKAQEKVQAGDGMSVELKDTIETVSDKMIETIEAIEKTT